MTNYKYQINLYSPFKENQDLLKQLYLPIIGSQAIDLYNELRYQYENNIVSIFTHNNNHKTLLKIRDLDWDTFVSLRKKLEAVNLVKTYLNETEKCFYYVLVQPLSYDEFINDSQMYSLLKNRTSSAEFNKIQYSFKKFMQTSNMIDLSESIQYLITDTEQRDVFLYNFEKLSEKLSAQYHTIINIDYNTKKIIDDFYNEQKLKFDDIFKIICSCIVKAKNSLEIDSASLMNKINEYKEIKKEELICKQTYIKRDSRIFDIEQNINQFEYIINDYKKYKTENYIAITTKQNISTEILEWINILRNNYDFNDSYINAIVDYVNIKNKGLLHKNYILKIANSINSLACRTIEEVIDYLRSTKMITKTNNIISQINNQIDIRSKKINSDINKKQVQNNNSENYNEKQLRLMNCFK